MPNDPRKLPTEPPATGGWYWDAIEQRARFLMPPFPGVDDCVQLADGKWAYRKLLERDRHRDQPSEVDGTAE